MNDPDDHPIIDEVERTLFNVNCEVQIGENIFNACQENRNITCNSLGCCFAGKNKEWVQLGNNNRAKVIIKLTAWPWKAKGKVVSYRLRNGNWKRFRTNLFVEIKGPNRNSSCSIQGPPFFDSKARRRAKLKARQNIWGAFPLAYVFDNELCGLYEVDGNSIFLCLTF